MMGTGSATGRLKGHRSPTPAGITDVGVLGLDLQAAVAEAKAAAVVAMYTAVESAVRDGRVAIECTVGPDGDATMRAVAAPEGLAGRAPEGVTLQVCTTCASVHPREVDR